MANVDEAVKPQVIDITTYKGNMGAQGAFNPEANPMDRKPPIPAGEYDLAFSPAKEDAVTMLLDDKKQEVFTLNLVCKVPDGPHKDRIVYHKINTRVTQNGTTTAGFWMLKGGCPIEKIQACKTSFELISLAYRFFAKKEPIIKGCIVEWQGWSKTAERVVFSKMTNFPVDRNGGYESPTTFRHKDGQTEEISATPKIIGLSDGKKKKEETKTTTPTAKVKIVPQEKAVEVATDDNDDDANVDAFAEFD
jgi:hypothetical protein